MADTESGLNETSLRQRLKRETAAVREREQTTGDFARHERRRKVDSK